jgi:UDP-N-acetylmuramate dehydrogenase
MSAPQELTLVTGSDPARFAAFREEATRQGLTVSEQEPLARHTTFRIGGPADLYAAAASPHELGALARLAWAYDVPALVLGGGSNMLVGDAGVRGLVIANQSRAIVEDPHDGKERRDGAAPAGKLPLPFDRGRPQIIADSGVALAGLARWAMRAGWSGLEWAVSIPGTVGGAIVGNAGAHGGEIADNLAWALAAMPDGGQAVLTAEELAFAYRSSMLKRRLAQDQAAPVVLTAGFSLTPGDAAEMTARAESFLAHRRATQPVEPSVGSIFRNPPGDYAGRLVEAAGLKGHRRGGACISLRHANFIVNDSGQARAADVLALIILMRTRVFEMAGVELIPEILFVGDWPSRPPYAPVGLRA